MASAATSQCHEGSSPGRKPPGFLDLPIEARNLIFNHCSQADLICLALVSKHFRDLAAAQLYRIFHIVFPDEEDPASDSLIDSLAGGLDTFATSDYNYARWLRDISLDTLSAGEKAESAYKPYLYSTSCGKFLNTLLLITLRKAKSLERFQWNIRVELSRPVYQALHQITTLKHLHLRLQAGPSLFEPPPPLPYPIPTTPQPNPPVNDWHPITFSIPLPPPPPIGLGTGLVSLPYASTPVLPPPMPPAPKVHAPKTKRKPLPANEPATLSGFQKLRSLAVLDIDNLELVSEIKKCVQSSFLTLNKLKLSFSPSLANQSRKPNPNLDHDEDDPDDEFHIVPMGPGQHWDDAAAPVKAFRAQEERKRQDEVLAGVFGIEPAWIDKTQKKMKDRKLKHDPKETRSGAEIFMERLKEVSAKLVAGTEGTEPDDLESREAVLTMIQEAAEKYLQSNEAKAATETAAKTEKDHSTTKPSDEVSTASKPAKPKFKEASPEDIDVEEPIPDEADDNTETNSAPEKAAPPSAPPATANVTPSSSTYTRSPDAPQVSSTRIRETRGKDSTTPQKKINDDPTTMSDYIRSTRGASLHSFSVHLIPVKASVLKASLDLRVLKRLTLLNVGPQTSIWSMLSKENKISPLPLRKIFTDNVSMAFLTCVAQLEEVTELFMLERAENYRPESFAPKTSVNMNNIRRLVLRRHIGTLKRLMIKNDVDSSWDAEEKTVLLMCNRGKQLEELAVGMGIRAMHTFLQHFPGLPKLRALNVVHFRSEDTCPWVMRETRRFLIDNLSHHPELVLEWISIDDDRVERVIRGPFPSDRPDSDKKKKKKKGKGKASVLTSSDPETSSFPELPLNNWDNPSDSDDEDTDVSAQLKLETIPDVHFYDVWDVRIFKKEVMTGRL
ncbi:uncharacterized protein VDAG_00554 [Verticillium dahliae VdLs.17]|uniref:F-box domain-containing protein n=2 Tax=Verticillium dahliae TaxID=27337 RepID=G2WQB2_VERDV|nr:uncharacterized protein VDAG_00554 [Verticillium dahliae VdLs.17]KAF3350664.1 Leucine-rich repeat-containing protein 40 [Verticillium dahliae VDG2]KAH6710342.1 hypothetical protein EV126DRAFT_354126 [Verticillium dahliae]EGY13872.1 hypothetical protein VDAG_00554 [Verticillium dahliae VdLs.17]PNH33138.1 hypothetical protein BJF96_g3367 [Verticillium dahliae]PNH55734.1 hypothetical protein VD0003_g1887 [Verticillium dahliae]